MRKPKLTKLQECEGAMYRLRETFNTGRNNEGEYGRNTRQAYDRWAEIYENLTGTKAQSIYK